jgi:hypothetical protein
MLNTQTGRSLERGAVIIQVAVVLLGLMAFSAFVVDYGLMWSARGQAQTAADAGALAGTIALAYDSPTDFAGAKSKAQAIARANWVMGQSPDVQLSDITFPPCPPLTPGLPDTCVKVNVFRNQARSNSLPMLFGRLAGVNSQGVRATATAQIATGDTTDCLRPWAIVDRWDEYNGAHANPNYPNPDPDWTPTSTYDKYSDGRGNNPPPEPDLYVPPTGNSAGTGFTLPADEGRQFAIKVGDSNGAVSSGWFRAIRIPRADGCASGANCYEASIESCGGLPDSYADPATVCPADIAIADEAYWAARGCYRVETGNMVGPTRQGIDAVVARDPNARWIGGIGGSIDPSSSLFSPVTSSPRVVPIGVLNIDAYLAQNPNGSGAVVRLENIYGFFIEGMGDVDANTGAITLRSNGRSVIGRIMTIPATATRNSRRPTNASFLRTIILVR